LLPQPLGQVRVPTQKGASIAMRKSAVGDVAMLESWFETVQKQPKGKVLERCKKGILEASPKFKTNPCGYPKTQC
jgi:hypothetical protein